MRLTLWVNCLDSQLIIKARRIHCCLSPSIQLSQLNWTIVGPEKKILHYLDCFIKVLAISNHPTLIFNHFLKKYGRVSVVEPIKTLHLYKQI